MADNRKADIEMEKLDQTKNFEAPPSPPQPRSSTSNSVSNNAALSVLAYCGSSILMTVMNKYVLSSDFNLNFFLLCVQVCAHDQIACLPDADSPRAGLSLSCVLLRSKRVNPLVL